MAVNARDIPPSMQLGSSFSSSGIREAIYFAAQRELRITFASGRTYAYRDVPPSIYDAFAASPSKGAFFSIAIRGRFQFHELAKATAETTH